MPKLKERIEYTKEEYNNEPVYYCKNCLSLNIQFIKDIEDTDFCDECSSTDIGCCSIEEWRRLYKEKYGFDYLDKY